MPRANPHEVGVVVAVVVAAEDVGGTAAGIQAASDDSALADVQDGDRLPRDEVDDDDGDVDRYDIYRSISGPDNGFTLVGSTTGEDITGGDNVPIFIFTAQMGRREVVVQSFG